VRPVLGTVIGPALGALGHAMSGGRGDFSSVPDVRAEAYEVLVDTEVAAPAAQPLDAQGAPGRGSDALAS
jgi:hypothetical protein